MKKDLSSLLKPADDSIPNGDFISERTSANYVAKYLIGYIVLELQNLPKDHWEKTLKTWIMIISLAKSLQTNMQRELYYRQNKFDMVMEGITEDVIHTINGFQSIGLLKKDFKPYELIQKSLELMLKYNKQKEYELFEEPFNYLCAIFKLNAKT